METIKGRYTKVQCGDCKKELPDIYHDWDQMSDPDFHVVCKECMIKGKPNNAYINNTY